MKEERHDSEQESRQRVSGRIVISIFISPISPYFVPDGLSTYAFGGSKPLLCCTQDGSY